VGRQAHGRLTHRAVRGMHLAELQPLADSRNIFRSSQEGRPAGREVQHPGGGGLFAATRPEPETERRWPTSFAAPFRWDC
jgi:hypothetical protein